MSLIAFITDSLTVKRILDQLGLSPPELSRPPPPRELSVVPVDEQGRELASP